MRRGVRNISTTSKGNKYQREVANYLISKDIKVHVTVRTPVWRGGFVRGSHSNDVFNVFDIIAYQRNGFVRFIQVTSHPHSSEKRNKIDVEFGGFELRNNIFEVWGRKPNKIYSMWVKNPKDWFQLEDINLSLRALRKG